MTEGWSNSLRLFEGVGIEIEYMIVDRQTLEVRPVCDRLFEQAAGGPVSGFAPDGDAGLVSWSNELALHVIELKSQRPQAALDGLGEEFHSHVRRVNALLEPIGCMLLPTGMHPWMDPDRETRLWPHEFNEVYRTYDRIFGCRGHGWGNVQSTHLNLPFGDDEEFGRLHAAVRLALPLLPALAASSPLAGGQFTPFTDYRMEVYRTSSPEVPMMVGAVIPEPVFTREAYERDILGPLYEQLRPFDPDGVLRHDFANGRGGMPRFDRGSIEIRVLDTQECPQADLAIAALVTELVRALVEERWISYERQRAAEGASLQRALWSCIKHGERACIAEEAILTRYGLDDAATTAGEVWARVLELVMPSHPVYSPLLRRMVGGGSLATRIREALPEAPGREAVREVYRELASCLQDGRLFRAP